MAFVCVGCMGSTPEDYEDPNTDFEDTKTLDMYGIKVLYRPDSYDFNEGSGGTADEENDYYGKYAYNIMNQLYGIYAIPNTSQPLDFIQGYAPQFYPEQVENPEPGKEYGTKADFLPYLYDSVRYKVDTLGTVNNIEIKSGEFIIRLEPTEADPNNIEVYKNGQKLDHSNPEYLTCVENYGSKFTTFEDYYIVGANTQAAWNWSFDYDITPVGYDESETTPSLDAYLNYRDGNCYTEKPFLNNQHLYNTYILTYDEATQEYIPSYNAEDYYSSQTNFAQSSYQQNFLSSGSETDYSLYSQFTKALEYVIYSYALDLEPATITVEHLSSPIKIGDTDYYYSMNVAGFESEGENSSVEVALNYIKNLFNKCGSFVGLTSLQITKIENWILENVIGAAAYSNDTITTFSNVKEVIDYNKPSSEGAYTRTYEFDISSDVSSVEFGRRYEEVVHNIIDGVCTLVSIGNNGEGGGNVNIDERFLASEIKEYAGNTFVIGDDANFPKYEEGQSDVAILPLEYQSVVLMLNKLQFIENMYIALKYDADLSGTEEGKFGSEYIEIQVDLNYYNHANDVYCTLASKVAKVYDGPYDIEYMPFDGDSGAGDGIAPPDHVSGVEFSSIGKMWKDNPLGDILPVNAFNPEIGNKVLMTEDMKATNYDGTVLVSRSPLVLLGTTDVRKWYSIVEPTENDPLVDADHTYISGRLNHEMFKGSDGCDYLEITYKVLKKPGDANKNYKFYTGIALIDSSDKPIN